MDIDCIGIVGTMVWSGMDGIGMIWSCVSLPLVYGISGVGSIGASAVESIVVTLSCAQLQIGQSLTIQIDVGNWMICSNCLCNEESKLQN